MVEAGRRRNPRRRSKWPTGIFELIAGKLDGMQAYSSGKLKVEGDIMKAQLIGKLFRFGK